MSRRLRFRLTQTGLYILVAVMLIFLLFPIYWMINTSFKSEGEVHMLRQSFFPRKPTIEGFAYLFRVMHFGPVFVNTVIVSTLSGLGCTVLGAMAGYGFDRFESPGKGLLYGFFVVSMALPGMVTVGPIFFAYKDIGLMDTKLGLIFVYTSFGLPFAVYYLYSFFGTIPRDIDDAALIDGCSRAGLLYRVILPLIAPGVVITVLILFVGAWNEFTFANILTTAERSRMLTVRIQEIPLAWTEQTHLLAAGGMVALTPIILLILIGQNRIVEGLVSGSVKG